MAFITNPPATARQTRRGTCAGFIRHDMQRQRFGRTDTPEPPTALGLRTKITSARWRRRDSVTLGGLAITLGLVMAVLLPGVLALIIGLVATFAAARIALRSGRGRGRRRGQAGKRRRGPVGRALSDFH
tara:strand:- start:6583 stop:6969 length:387 start_codon:yes stop_codon:yes gene_type:complete